MRLPVTDLSTDYIAPLFDCVNLGHRALIYKFYLDQTSFCDMLKITDILRKSHFIECYETWALDWKLITCKKACVSI